MSERQDELAHRRDDLLAEADMQRKQLAALAQDIEARLEGLDRGIHVARTVAKKPIVIDGAIALIAAIGPRRLLRAATRSAALVASSRQVVKLFRG